MTGPDPLEHGWWLASRAAGIVALLCMTASVGIGLALAARVTQDRRTAQLLGAAHQHTALAALVAIAVHGITLLGDDFLRPTIADVAVPFAMDRDRVWTGAGVAAGWLGAALGLSYWIRDRIGPRRWRALHRATIVVYAASVAHTFGAGTDAGQPWMQVLVLATGAPVLFLLLLRLLPAPRARPAGRAFRVGEITPESSRVTSFALEPVDGRPLEPFVPGQFVTVHVDVPGHGALQRAYSLSAAPDPRRLRISVARDGVVSTHLHTAVRTGDVLHVGDPAGAFALDPDPSRAAVLLSAGVGATPLLAMLGDLAARRSQREVWWVHVARSARDHAFAEEARSLVERLPAGRLHVHLTSESGRPGAQDLLDAGVPVGGAFHLCGPRPFVDAMTEGLRQAGATAIVSEAFGGGPAPPRITFRRSGVEATWARGTLLDLADAHGIRTGAACRVGSCQGCRTPVLAGAVEHDGGVAPPDRSALLCCARPSGDVVLDV